MEANQFSALTEAIVNSMFRANFMWRWKMALSCNETVRNASRMKLLGKEESR
jgi:hypothetical protein